MAKKRYDPLWEIVDEKIPLQGQQADVDGVCPHCQVRVHIGQALHPGDQVECGLCGGLAEIVNPTGPEDTVTLSPLTPSFPHLISSRSS